MLTGAAANSDLDCLQTRSKPTLRQRAAAKLERKPDKRLNLENLQGLSRPMRRKPCGRSSFREQLYPTGSG